MNWLVTRGFLPITKSETIEHIDEHLESVNFEMEKEDLEKINKFRAPGWKTPEIDWDRTGEGIVIHNLPNVFDELYDELIK